MKKIFLVLALSAKVLNAQNPTVGLIEKKNDVAEGYTLVDPLFCPLNNCGTYLINNCGEVVKDWPNANRPGLSAKLLPNGNLLRPYSIPHAKINAGGFAGGLQMFDFEGNLLWDYVVANETQNPHHEVTPLPNGNILVLIWSRKDSAECVAKGRKPQDLKENDKSLWSDKIIEIRPIFPDSAEIVWEWDNWDHLVQNVDQSLPSYGEPSAHPELFDINYLGWSMGVADWLHTNAIDYNPKLDQIAISSRFFHEVYIIDHSTTTAEAAGHTGGKSNKGGDIMYRWGNPEAYGKTTHPKHRLFAQHNVHWIEDSLTDAGKLMIFNNGTSRTPIEFSSIDIIDPKPDSLGRYHTTDNGTFGPDSAEWTYIAPNPADFHSQYIAGAQRLKNGNTLICDGTHGTLFEINPNKEIVWKYISPMTTGGLISQGQNPDPFPTHGTNNWVFRALKYMPEYPAFNGKALESKGYVELNPIPHPECTTVNLNQLSAQTNSIVVFPNPASDFININGVNPSAKIRITNLLGQTQKINPVSSTENTCTVNIQSLINGTYHIQIIQNNETKNLVFVIAK